MRFGNNEFDACLKRNASAASFRGASETSDRFRAIASRQRPRTVMLRSMPRGKTCVTNWPGPSGFLAAGCGGMFTRLRVHRRTLVSPAGPDFPKKPILSKSIFENAKMRKGGARACRPRKAARPHVGGGTAGRAPLISQRRARDVPEIGAVEPVG